MNKHSASEQYNSVNAQTGIVDADPHRLIQMLFAGALQQIAVAKGCIQRDDIAGKGTAISKAIGIVDGLQSSVNHDVESNGLSDNLAALYDFVNRKLSEANVETSVAALDEAAKVMKELEAGWNEIRPQAMAASANELSSA
ncbi:MAG: flagellar export chaperone FliS [Pseudomonadales bacterium]|nr:flagellar export chaperone FliS [Pseudomonadales bacterium]